MAGAEFDIVIRGGTIIDGSGTDRFVGDVAIAGGRIAAVGEVAGRGREEIDATGKLVTPGFVDIHTHYDGQATWEHTLAPSSNHGVTTVVTGNCGVGFAPVRPQDHDKLIKVMEGVEDIPEIVMAEGLPWNWESFPDFLDALEARSFDVDVACQLAHSPVRVYVMGDRGAAHEVSSDADRRAMRDIVTEAIRAGAIGITTSRSVGHRLKNGELAPSVSSADEELYALAGGVKAAGAGVFQIIPNYSADAAEEMAVIGRIAEISQAPVSFSCLQSPLRADNWRIMIEAAEGLNAAGLPVRAQVFPRPVGILMGLDLTLHPFVTRPACREIAHLPLAGRVAMMKDPAFKARVLTEPPIPDPQLENNYLIAQVDKLFALSNPVDYAPSPDMRLGARAEAAGVSVESLAYDLLLEDGGRQILYLPGANFVGFSLDSTREMMVHPQTLIGLGDGGAHYGCICDASYTTFLLTYWVRDVPAERQVGLEWAIGQITRNTAEAVGLTDRGLLRPGLKADVNIIDHEQLTLFAPRTVYDLPAGGRRLRQIAKGYVATIVSGIVTRRDDEPTGQLPGRLVRGKGYSPLARAA